MSTLQLTYNLENLKQVAGEFFLEQGVYPQILDFTIEACLKSYNFAFDKVALSSKTTELKNMITTQKEKEIAAKVFAYAQAREELRSSLEIYLETFKKDLEEGNIELKFAE